MGTFNCQSIQNKTVGVLEHLIEVECDICFVQETFLRVGDDAKLSEIKDYGMNVLSNPRKHRSGGGIAMLYKSNFQLKSNNKVVKYKSFQVMESLLQTTDDLIRLVNIYRPGYSKKARHTHCDFLQEFEDYLRSVHNKQGIPIIAGYFNFHVERPDENYPKKLLELLDQFNLQQHVPLIPTHKQGGTLDLVITTREFGSKINSFDIRDSGTDSDHYLVLFDVNLKVAPTVDKVKFTNYRNFKNINVESFKADILDSDLCNHDTNISVDEAVNLFDTTLTHLMDKHCPLIHKKMREKSSPWIDEELRNLRRKRRAAERCYRKEKTQTAKQRYRSLRDQFTKLTIIKRSLYYKKSLRNSSSDIKTLYKKINRLLGNIAADLPEHQDDAKLAENFKNFFGEKIEIIKQHIDKEATGIENCSAKNQGSDVNDLPEGCKLQKFSTVTKEDLVKIVSNMSNKFCCLDPIPTFLLKKCVHELSTILLFIVNKSLSMGVFPQEIKKAVIKPTLKKSDADTDDMSNYRPVSNLSVISKVLERAALNQLNDHLSDNELYCSVQSGYRPNHSCETLLVRMFDDIGKKVKDNQMVIVVLLDLSAAFDTIDHGILLKKLLNDYGISDTALLWIKSYLENRSYCVKINDSISSVIELLFGVPQGSLLGPILFILYTKSLQEIAVRHGLDIQLYADDSQLYIGFNSNQPGELSDVKKRITECLDDIKTWMVKNCMKLNERKTELLVFGKPLTVKTLDADFNIRFGETVICRSSWKGDEGKSLGVVLDASLTMDRQIAAVKKRCSWTMMNLRTIGHYLDENIKIMLVKQLVISKLDYCNAIYMNIAKKRLKKLRAVLDTAIRFIYNINDRCEDLIPYYI